MVFWGGGEHPLSWVGWVMGRGAEWGLTVDREPLPRIPHISRAGKGLSWPPWLWVKAWTGMQLPLQSECALLREVKIPEMVKP